jgi:CheY-like chemotaxis protein
MTENSPDASLNPPAGFVAQVQQVLEHLHDFPFLLSHALSHRFRRSTEHPGEVAGQQLRREAIKAIESLSPGPGVSFRASHARLYNVLHLHYVEGMTINEAAGELNISLRQTYRDLRRGEECVAAILWTYLPGPADGLAEAHIPENKGEVERMALRASPVDARQWVERAHKAVERLAHGRAVNCVVSLPTHPVIVVADGVLAQQVLIGLFSHAIQQADPGDLSLQLADDGEAAIVTLAWHGAAFTHETVAQQLVERLGWPPPQPDDHPGSRGVALRIPYGGATILVVDDNADLGELFERYLAGQPCRVMQATSGDQGIRLAREMQPDAVVLDVMMPEVDGWQVLQTLQADPSTSDIPVVVCSVISDPQLAASLGAAASLSKPIGRDEILATLRHLGLI